MGKKVIPDAWDDDWETQADKEAEEQPVEPVKEEAKITKAERLAKHAETNKKIWESAETPETFHFLAARDNVPLKQEFKPALKVLSRKPAPTVVQRVDPLTGVAKLTLDDEDEEDEPKANQLTPEELRLRAQREREEKQKRYDEARARILGTGSGVPTPTSTPPNEENKNGRGRGRGGKDIRQENRRPNSQSGPKAGPKELFDPNYTPKPGVTIQKRNGEPSRSGRSTPKPEDQIIREPKGPEGNSRGFGFANRGGKSS